MKCSIVPGLRIIEMSDNQIKKIGLISDSHSNNEFMLKAIHTLREKGVDLIIHLGDFCDSLKPGTMDEAVDILLQYNVRTILGNNEYMIKTEYIPNNPGRLRETTVSFLNELPYNFIIDDLCFTHSLPYEWPAATRQPLESIVRFPLVGDLLPFRIMFRGHSHSLSVLEYFDERKGEVSLKAGETVRLKNDRKYIITVGAIEEGFYALFDPEREEFLSLSI